MLNIITSNAGRASETFVESARPDGEDNLAWLRRALGDLPAPEIEGTPTHLVLFGGRDQISFRLRVAQAHLRHDMTPSHWSHAALLGPVRNDARRTQTYEVSLEPAGGFGIPAATNALQVGRITAYADPDRYPNICRTRCAFRWTPRCGSGPPPASRWRWERFEKQRSVLDVTELVLQWLAFLWGVGRAGNPLLEGYGVPTAAMIEVILSAVGYDITPALESRASCPEVICRRRSGALVLPGAEPGSDRWPMACRPADRPLDAGSVGVQTSLWPQPSGQFPVNGSDRNRSGPRSYAPARGCVSMAVEKAIELIGTGPSIQDAVQEALDRAELTLEASPRSTSSTSRCVEGGRSTYRVRLRVWFTLLERVHG